MLYLGFRATSVALALAAAASLSQAQEVYVTTGFPLVQVGYAHSIAPQFGVRADFGTSGSFSKDGEEEGIEYLGKIKQQRLGVFADYFPFSGGFRITGGVTMDKTELKLNSNLQAGDEIEIGDELYETQGSEYLNVKVKMPSTMPYLGIGWGHNASQKGWGFVADLGVSFGKAKLSYDTNLLDIASGVLSQEDIDKEISELRDGVGKIRFMPQISVGVSYTF